MFLLPFFAFFALSRRSRSRRKRSRNGDMTKDLKALASNGNVTNLTGDKFLTLAAMLDKPELFNLDEQEARILLLIHALNQQK